MRYVYLLILALLMVAVTALNSYTTQCSVAYFNDASKYEATRLAYVQATQVHQDFIDHANVIIGSLYQDREEARGIAKKFFVMLREKQCAIESQSDYIKELEAALNANNIALPQPALAPPAKSEPKIIDRQASYRF